jgi:hypothetical protein
MGRYQRGHIYEVFGAFHVRYRLEEIVDGKLVGGNIRRGSAPRARVSPRPRRCAVCAMSSWQRSTRGAAQPEAADLTVSGFWELTYWPFVVETSNRARNGATNRFGTNISKTTSAP